MTFMCPSVPTGADSRVDVVWQGRPRGLLGLPAALYYDQQKRPKVHKVRAEHYDLAPIITF